MLEQIRERGKTIAGPDLYAQDAMILFQGGYMRNAIVQALSPSAATITNSHTQLAARLLTKGQIRKFKRFEPNDLSVAVHVSIGPVNLLLGADLENTDEEAFGWKAVLVSDSRPNKKALLFKVAHHGSKNADHDQAWETLLESDPISVVTPFSRQSVPLPGDDDVARIKSHTNKLYTTTWPPSNKPRKRRGVDGIVAGTTRVRRSLNREPGFIRLRYDLHKQQSEPKIDLFGSAKKL